MRIIVMFDLPTGTPTERKTYSQFRKFLIDDGYSMEQYSVYSRVTLGRDNLDTHILRIQQNLPDAGSVTVFTMTERQYEQRMVLLKAPSSDKIEKDFSTQLTLFF